MGWVFSAMGLSGTLAAAPQSGAGVALGGLGWFTFFFLTFAVLPMLYPTGETLGPRWRWVLFASIIALPVSPPLGLPRDHVSGNRREPMGGRSASNRCRIRSESTGSKTPKTRGRARSCSSRSSSPVVAGLVSLAIRYRRARGVERQQLKWLVLSLAALMSFVFLFDIFLAEWFGFQLPDTAVHSDYRRLVARSADDSRAGHLPLRTL